MALVSETGKRSATYTQTIDIASIGAGATLDVTVSEINLPLPPAAVFPIPPDTLEAGVCVCGAWIDSTGDIILRVSNPTGVAIDPASAVWSFMVLG